MSAADSVEGEGGQIVSAIDLDLAYAGSAIEHQIDPLPNIEGYLASSWLSFVTSDQSESDDPLREDLGKFEVPMVLRAFPKTPAMVDQTQTSILDVSKPATGPTKLADLTKWGYTFTYSLPFHYPQDSLICEIDFNVRNQRCVEGGLEDAFRQLAQFITVFPDVKQDIATILAKIDANTTDETLIDNARTALKAFINMVSDIVEHAKAQNFCIAPPRRMLSGAEDQSYKCTISET